SGEPADAAADDQDRCLTGVRAHRIAGFPFKPRRYLARRYKLYAERRPAPTCGYGELPPRELGRSRCRMEAGQMSRARRRAGCHLRHLRVASSIVVLREDLYSELQALPG